MTSKEQSDRNTRRMIPHKVKNGLENILIYTHHARTHWRELVAHAEEKGDMTAGLKLARISDDLSEIERNARAARNGEEV